MKSEKDWIWLISGLAFGTLLGITLYPRVFKKDKDLVILDPRVEKIKSLIDEADHLIKKSKKTK